MVSFGFRYFRVYVSGFRLFESVFHGSCCCGSVRLVGWMKMDKEMGWDHLIFYSIYFGVKRDGIRNISLWISSSLKLW
jgi:hypothetical protein